MKLTEHCYAIVGLGFIPPWTVNSGFIVGNHTTLVLDSGPHAHVAQTILGYATAAKPNNQLRLVNLEPHLDHISGNSLFVEHGIEVMGHHLINRQREDLQEEIEGYNDCIPELVRKNAYEASLIYYNTELQNPTTKINKEFTIDLGDIKVNIIFTPGHTKANISAFVEEERVLYCADTILQGYIPNLEAGTIEDWNTWLASLARIESLSPKLIVPGHGAVIKEPEVKSSIARMHAVIEQAIREGIAPTRKQ